MSVDGLRETFFAECEDLLDALAEGLSALEADASDDETVNAIFRAVHSIKGAAGAFGLSDLVDFTHRFETVLDLVRSGKLAVDEEVLHAVTRSGDCLANLIEAAHSESGDTPEAMAFLMNSLSDLIAVGGGDEDDGGSADFSFTAVTLEPLDLEPIETQNTFEIRFKPYRALFDNGHDPVHLIAALSDLGSLDVSCDVSGVPEINEFDPDESYLSWAMSLSGDVAEGEIRKVFAFVEGLCALSIAPATEVAAGNLEQTDTDEPSQPTGQSIAVGNREPKVESKATDANNEKPKVMSHSLSTRSLISARSS